MEQAQPSTEEKDEKAHLDENKINLYQLAHDLLCKFENFTKEGKTEMYKLLNENNLGEATFLAMLTSVIEEGQLNPNEFWSTLYYPLMATAVCSNDVEFVKIMLKYKGDPNIQWSSGGQTPLHIAAQQDSLDIIKLLLQAKADPSIKMHMGGQIPADFAINPAVEDLLRHHE